MVSNLQPCYSLGTEQSPSVEFFHTPFHTFHTIPHCATLPIIYVSAKLTKAKRKPKLSTIKYI